jgi:hypothetical protein
VRGGTGHQAGPARIRAQAASTQQAQGAGPRLDLRALPSRARLKLLASPVVRPVVRLSGAGAGVELRGGSSACTRLSRAPAFRARALRSAVSPAPARYRRGPRTNKNVDPVNVNLAKYTLHASDPMIARTAAGATISRRYVERARGCGKDADGPGLARSADACAGAVFPVTQSAVSLWYDDRPDV